MEEEKHPWEEWAFLRERVIPEIIKKKNSLTTITMKVSEKDHVTSKTLSLFSAIH